MGSLTVRPVGRIFSLRHLDRKVAWDWTWESLKQWCLNSLRKDTSMDRKEQTNNRYKRLLVQNQIFIFKLKACRNHCVQ